MDINGFAPIQPIADIGNENTTNRGTGFADLVRQAAQNVAADQTNAANLSRTLAEGGDVALQDVISAVGRAELTLQTMVTVRDRAVEAYQEILRMPI